MGFLDAFRDDSGVVADFIERLSDVELDTDRVATLSRLQPFHQAAVEALGFRWDQCWRAEQVHGGEVAEVRAGEKGRVIEGVDGLVTNVTGVMLGVYVADCGAVYLRDTVSGAIGLVHSGKKGTEANITGRALKLMQDHYGTRPEDVVVALAPCIRPPAYDVDFAATIREQVLAAGVEEVNYHDCGVCTSSDLERFYSYRVEKGATGRMLALLGKSV